MAGEIFWDTGGFFALLSKDALKHADAEALSQREGVTTDGIIGETCTLLIARNKPHLARKFLDLTERPERLRIVHLDAALIAETRAFLRKHLDHTYSFVDCSSFVVMERLRLREAASTDGHFTEAGFIALLR
jgi:predicted nucleic acid-binding protein